MDSPAAQKRAMLAEHYDKETADRLQLAQFANDAGLKSASSHLLTLAGKSRRFAEQAHKGAQLQGILAQVAAAQDANAPPNFFQQRMGISPEPAAPDATASAGGAMPAYAQGTPNMLEQLKGLLGVGGADNYTPVGEMQEKWNAGGGSSVAPRFSPILPWLQGEGPDTTPQSILDLIGQRQGEMGQIRARQGEEYVNRGMPAYRGGTGCATMPQYAGGSGSYEPGTHPGGPALVGEEGPEVVDLPAGSTVAPNILTVIRMLLDIVDSQNGGGSQEMPGYAFGTGSINRLAGGLPGGAGGGGGRGYTGSGTEFRPGDIQGDDGRFNANQGLQSLIEHGASAGAYDPLGSTQAADISRQAILGGMGGRQAAAGNLADIYAQGDPAFRAFARLKAQSDTQSQAARAYEQARAQQVGAAQGFSRDILGSQFGATLRKDPVEPNPWAQAGGQVLGAAIGAIPGGGAARGAVTGRTR